MAEEAGDSLHLTLNQAIEMVLEKNRGLRQGKLTLLSDRLNLETEESAFYIKITPGVSAGYNSDTDEQWNAGVSVSKEFQSGIRGSVRPVLGNNDDGYDSGVELSLTVPLFRGFGKQYATDSLQNAKYVLKSGEQDLLLQQNDVVLQTVSAVYTAIQYQQKKNYLEQQQKKLKEHLLFVKLKEKAGLVKAMDLYRAELRLQEVQKEITTTDELIANSLDSVKQILALAIDSSLILEVPVEFNPVELNMGKMVATALENRLEITISKLALDEAKRAVKKARNNLLPKVDLELKYKKSGEQEVFELENENWSLMLSSDTDFFRRTEKSQYQQALLNYRAALIRLEELKEKITREVRSQMNSLMESEKQIELDKQKIIQATGKMKLSESKFRHGMADNNVLLESQTEMQQAKTDLIVDTIRYISGTYQLRSILGTLVERKIVPGEKIQ